MRSLAKLKNSPKQMPQEAEFFEAFLERVIEAMGAVAGLVWLTGKEGRVEPIAHLKMQDTGLSDSEEVQSAHSGMVHALMNSPSGLLVPPQAAINISGRQAEWRKPFESSGGRRAD